MIRVCLVDDQNLVRQGLRSLLALVEDIEVVAEASDGVEALEVVARVEFEVMLLDLRMPRLDGIGVLAALQNETSRPAVLILTTFDDHELVLRGIGLGARGYMLKDVSLEQLTEGIRTLAGGGSLIKPAVTERVLQGLSSFKPDFESLPVIEPMTKREVEVLRMLAGGFSNKEIARGLFVAEGTVKNHISNILSKMGVRDRTRAVLKALELGLI